MNWVQQALLQTTNPTHRVHLQTCIRRLRAAARRAKHDVFYSIQPLLDRAFQPTNLQTLTITQLLDKLLLQIRLTTLLRSVDTAHIAWALFTQENHHFIRATDKKGHLLTLSVSGYTLRTLTEYLYRHRNHPGQFLFRHVNDLYKCLGAERLAKRLLHMMRTSGLDTETYKAHSLRGATATHLLRLGLPINWVQSRGNWTTQATLDTYYNRLHNTMNWERLLQHQTTAPGGPHTAQGGHAGKWQCAAACAEHPPKSALPNPTKEGERGADEGGCEAQAAALTALGIQRPLHQPDLRCPSCNNHMDTEAAYVCHTCYTMSHVRCMHATGLPGINTQITTQCFTCTQRRKRDRPVEPMPDTRKLRAVDHGLIVDVMGVCGAE